MAALVDLVLLAREREVLEARALWFGEGMAAAEEGAGRGDSCLRERGTIFEDLGKLVVFHYGCSAHRDDGPTVMSLMRGMLPGVQDI